jgi:hypothetical protein
MVQAMQAESGWTLLKEWSGRSGRTRTEPVTVPAGQWRVTFKATSGDRWGLLSVVVLTPEGREVGSAVNMHLLAFEDKERGGTLTVNSPEREYVLEIASDQLDWHVAVEGRK